MLPHTGARHAQSPQREQIDAGITPQTYRRKGCSDASHPSLGQEGRLNECDAKGICQVFRRDSR
jgi:hypothetical protein